MKKLILVCILCVYALPAQADLKGNVFNYLETYKGFIDNVRAGKFPNLSRVIVGAPTSLTNNLALLHMSEVIDVITTGTMNDCCFRSPPDVYENYANAKTEQVIKATTITNPGSATPFQIPSYLGTQMGELVQQFSIVAASLPTTSTGLDEYDAFAIEIMRSLAQDEGSSASNIFSNLMWGWSYIDSAHSELKESFKDYYIYACIVCDGAGFFNTAGLYTTNTVTGRLYYDDIVTPANFPASYAWLQKLTGQGPKPPLQASIGLTLQGQAKETERLLTAGVIYPAHCHQAEELYFGLDPMGVSKTAQSDILKGLNGYEYDTKSYGIGPINYSGLKIKFSSDLSSQFPHNFMPVKNGDIIYNASTYYHAFNAGARFQFTQWARLTWPQEGTYFPFNGGPQPPAGVECLPKPQ